MITFVVTSFTGWLCTAGVNGYFCRDHLHRALSTAGVNGYFCRDYFHRVAQYSRCKWWVMTTYLGWLRIANVNGRFWLLTQDSSVICKADVNGRL